MEWTYLGRISDGQHGVITWTKQLEKGTTSFNIQSIRLSNLSPGQSSLRYAKLPPNDLPPPGSDSDTDSIASTMSYGSVGRTNGTATSDERRSRVISTRSVRSTRTIRDVHTQGKASILSSVTNLTNTVIGAGALAFPSAFAAMGLLPGIISCIYSGSVTSFGLYLLTRCATMVGRRPGDEGRVTSFNEVARITFGKGWATRIFDVKSERLDWLSIDFSSLTESQLAIAIKCFGVSISYLIICKVSREGWSRC